MWPRKILFALLAITLFTCEYNDMPQRGTILKKYISDGNTQYPITSLYQYDDAGYLTDINLYTNLDIFDPGTFIKYKEGRVVKINDDSLIYKNGVLTKTMYAQNDTTLTSAEFHFENGRLMEKVDYLIFKPEGISSKPRVTDTTYIQYSHDELGNVTKITTTGNKLGSFGPSIFTLSGYETSFEYDSKISPVIDFPLEFKWVRNINPGPNNIVKQSEESHPNSYYNINYSIQYNLDNRPMRVNATSTRISNRIIRLEYY